MWPGRGLERATLLFVALIVISVGILTFDLRSSGAGIGDTIRNGTQAVFEPVQRAVDFVTRPVVGLFEGINDIFSLRDENERLRNELASLRQDFEDVEVLQARIAELEAILGVEPPEGLDSITARVLAVGVSEFDNIRIIDKGRADGVGVDMPVVDEGGLVGRVVSVTNTSARVRLITDPTMRIAVRVDRTGETGVVSGRGLGPLTLEMFNASADVVVGDLLVTADGRFPAGLRVGRVTESAAVDVGFVLRTDAEASAEVSRVDFVRVLVFTRDQAPSPTDTTTTTTPGDTSTTQSGEGEGEGDPGTSSTTQPETTTTTVVP